MAVYCETPLSVGCVCFGLALAAGLPAHALLLSSRFSCISSDISVTYLLNPLKFLTQD